MKFEVHYHHLVLREDIPKLSKSWGTQIKQAIENKLMVRPEIFGKPLRKSLKGYRKLRIEDYRVIFKIEKDIVKIFAIQHRSVIYNIVHKRL